MFAAAVSRLSVSFSLLAPTSGRSQDSDGVQSLLVGIVGDRPASLTDDQRVIGGISMAIAPLLGFIHHLKTRWRLHQNASVP
jgi:hypothetical protein